MKALIGILLLIAEISHAGGGSCGYDCPPPIPEEPMQSCEIVDVVRVNPLPTGAHKSYTLAQKFENQVFVGNKASTLGDGNQINYLQLAGAPYIFQRWSSTSTIEQFFSPLVSGTSTNDYPLLSYVFIYVVAEGNTFNFSVVFKNPQTIMDTNPKLITTLSGKMNCY